MSLSRDIIANKHGTGTGALLRTIAANGPGTIDQWITHGIGQPGLSSLGTSPPTSQPARNIRSLPTTLTKLVRTAKQAITTGLSSKLVGVRAFTPGSQIAFGQAGNPADHQLLANELSHKLQQ